jgi:hypothetical protein
LLEDSTFVRATTVKEASTAGVVHLSTSAAVARSGG